MIQTGLAETSPEYETPFDVEAAVHEVQGGTLEAFDGIYRECAPAVYKQLFRLCGGNESRAEDLTQITFLKAFTAVGQYQQGTFHGWLSRIARNSFLDECRSGEVRRTESLDAYDPDARERLYPTVPSLETEVDTAVDLQPFVQRVKRTLPETYAQAVCATTMSDLNDTEAAQFLGIPVGTLKSRVHRGKKMAAEYVPVPAGYERAKAS